MELDWSSDKSLEIIACDSWYKFKLILLRLVIAQVYKKGGTNQNKSMEITYEQMQKELGLGVQIE